MIAGSFLHSLVLDYEGSGGIRCIDGNHNNYSSLATQDTRVVEMVVVYSVCCYFVCCYYVALGENV